MLNDIIKNIAQIIQFKSYEDKPAAGAPFGLGVKAALDFYLLLADYLGFETKNYDGYAGEVTFGSGEEFAILAHLDVVPAGSGWTHEPFGGEVDEVYGRVWGRGAMDDKGPAIICLYALKALKDEGFNPSRKIKLIVGCNEETGSKCMQYYKEHAHMPDEGFSPDASFPVIYAEKGILDIKFTFPVEGDYSSLKGGERSNMVCDYCSFETDESERAKAFGLDFQDGKAISRGKSAHASLPSEGENAIPKMLKFLGLDDVERALFVDCFGLTRFKDETGDLTFSPDIISGGKGFIEVVVNIRCPATMPILTVYNQLDGRNVKYEVLAAKDPLYSDKEGKLVSTLCKVYNEVAGTKNEPIAIGGGTYARELKFGAAFGPEEDGEENTIHKADEYITFEKIRRCLEIYKKAIKELTE